MGSSILQAILGGVAGGASGIAEVREARRLEEERKRQQQEMERQRERQEMLDRVGLAERGWTTPEKRTEQLRGAAPGLQSVLSSAASMMGGGAPRAINMPSLQQGAGMFGAPAGEITVAGQRLVLPESEPARRAREKAFETGEERGRLQEERQYQERLTQQEQQRLRTQRDEQAKAAQAAGLSGREVDLIRSGAVSYNDLMSERRMRGESERNYQLRLRELGIKEREGAGAPKTTEGERKASAFLTQAEAAAKIIDEVVAGGKRVPSITERVSAGVLGGAVSPFVSSKEQERINAAGLRLADSWLRFTSGAAVPESEVRRYAMAFMPQPGEDEQTLADKAEARQYIIESLRQAAGRARPAGGASNPYR